MGRENVCIGFYKWAELLCHCHMNSFQKWNNLIHTHTHTPYKHFRKFLATSQITCSMDVTPQRKVSVTVTSLSDY